MTNLVMRNGSSFLEIEKMIKATIIADSISAHTDQRITTFELEYPRFIHAEFLTHRQFSRNSASSRAIPIDKMIEQVKTNPAYPIHWGLNQSGMQAKDEQAEVAYCINAWIEAKNRAIESAKELQSLGLHKQIVNRVLEPFQMMKTLVTTTNFDNFFNLRCHKDAQPEIKQLADLMYQAMQESKPEVLNHNEWHTPYVNHKRLDNGELCYYVDVADDFNEPYQLILSQEEAIKISCSCSAQVSYRKNDISLDKAEDIFDRLIGSDPKHSSALEHCATPIPVGDDLTNFDGITHWIEKEQDEFIPCSGNFISWIQYRQLIPNHDCKEYISRGN